MSPDPLARLLGEGAHRPRMGLGRTSAGPWLDARTTPARIAARRAILDAHPSRCRALPGARSVEGALARLGSRGPFEALARELPVDLLVVDRETLRLDAIAVAMPSAWSPERALGRSVDAIHAIVPGLDEALGPAIGRFLGGLDEGAAYERANWGLAAGDALDRHPEGPAPRLTRDVPLDAIRLRVEEQLFVGVPAGVLFAIHVVERPLPTLAEPALRARLHDALATMSPALARYKGLEDVRPALLRALRDPSA